MYLKIAFRSLIRNRIHTTINILGLAVGRTSSLLIFLWMENELYMNTYHVNGSHLYQIYEREYLNHHIDGDYDTLANRNLGYEKRNLTVIPGEGNIQQTFKTFQNESLNIPGINSVSSISNTFTFIDNGAIDVSWDGKDPGNTVSFSYAAIGFDFIKTLLLKLLSGSDFSKSYAADTNNINLN